MTNRVAASTDSPIESSPQVSEGHTSDKLQSLTAEELANYFQFPINEAAKELGICATVLKKICRQNGIDRWPHRKIKSIDKIIESLEEVLLLDPTDKQSVQQDLQSLYQKREYLLKHPNVSYKAVIPKHSINTFNARLQKAQHQKPDHLHNSKPRNAVLDSLTTPVKTITKPRYPQRSTRSKTVLSFDVDIDNSDEEEEEEEEDEVEEEEEMLSDAEKDDEEESSAPTLSTTKLEEQAVQILLGMINYHPHPHHHHHHHDHHSNTVATSEKVVHKFWSGNRSSLGICL